MTWSVLNLTAYSQHHFHKVSEIIKDINGDGRNDTIILSSSSKEKDMFNKVTVVLNRGRKVSFTNKYDWTVVDSSFLAKNKNYVNTDKLFIKRTDKQTAILLFGILDGAGYRESFSIINIEHNEATMVFDQEKRNLDVEIPTALEDINGDGHSEFIFTSLFELYKYVPRLNSDVGAYHPYFVYSIKGDTCLLDKLLTKKYNEQHYVFAGYKYSEDIQILYPRNHGKPRIWKKGTE
jgi:hypothetical protein